MVPRGYTNSVYPKTDPLDPISAKTLVYFLADLAQQDKQQVQILDWDWYVRWYQEDKKLVKTQSDRRLAGYYQRRGQHFLKLALVLSKSEGREHIETEDLEKANEILIHEEAFIPTVLSKVGEHPRAKPTLKILGILRHYGDWMTRTDLSRKTFAITGGKTELDRSLEDLLMQGLIERGSIGRAKAYRAAPEPSLVEGTKE